MIVNGVYIIVNGVYIIVNGVYMIVNIRYIIINIYSKYIIIIHVILYFRWGQKKE